MVDLAELISDLRAESADLDALVADVDLTLATPAPGWTIAHQISHLAWTDGVALLAVTDPAAFVERVVAEAGDDVTAMVDHGAADGIGPDLLPRWRTGREALAGALAAAPAAVRVPWIGTSMSPASMATARLMETWAHGQDVADALGVERTPTARLRHIAYLGYRTLGHGFAAHGRPAPDAPVRVELDAPDGTVWAFGPPDADDAVTGPALDFCLLVTQRRHHDDLALTATGPVAREWLDVAQAFAGPPGEGRQPRTAGPPGEDRQPRTAGPPGEGRQAQTAGRGRTGAAR